MQVGVIGSNSSQCSEELYDFAFKLGMSLGIKGYTIINGGMHGIMEAVSKGVKYQLLYFDCLNCFLLL